MLNPVFLKANLAFDLDQFSLSFKNKNISVYGVTGLPWAPLAPEKHFGKTVKFQAEVLSPTPLHIEAEAHILREQSINNQQMGLRFELEDGIKGELAKAIAANGFYPTEYIRKYPRIPASSSLQTFPLRVLAHLGGDKGHTPFILDVLNLSPNGILLKSENPLINNISPGSRMIFSLEPRGDFDIFIQLEGLVCWVADELDVRSRNQVRHFGLKFMKVMDEGQQAFVTLLKDILEQLKGQGQQPTL